MSAVLYATSVPVTISALKDVLLGGEAAAFFHEQLINQFPQQQQLPSKFEPMNCAMPDQPKSASASYNQQSPCFQSAAADIAKRFPDRAFVWYIKAYISHKVEIHSQAACQLQTLFDHRAVCKVH